ncbi:chemotaxis protein CheC [Sporofaciens musculi]|uniref:chemotaxis protein CheC n=1 Tax=Sporofaciens musculi TaxID=2681861 RepID=UPI001FCBA8C3|nr:chemotaxis protein CheC [Sporofaciens musculi]
MKEIGSIGGGNAATALSSMINAKVNMSLPKVEILDFNEALVNVEIRRKWSRLY